MLPNGWHIRELDDSTDRPALREFYARSSDYVLLETGLAPSEDTIDELFQNAPPGGDPKECVHLGLFDTAGHIHGICEKSFGFPNPQSSYLGLLMLAPADARFGRIWDSISVKLGRNHNRKRNACAPPSAVSIGLTCHLFDRRFRVIGQGTDVSLIPNTCF